MSTLVSGAQQFAANSGDSDNVTPYYQPVAYPGHVPTTSSENTAESYLARLSAVGANTIHPHAGVRLAYRSRSRLSCDGAVVRRAARNGLGGGRCIATGFYTMGNKDLSIDQRQSHSEGAWSVPGANTTSDDQVWLK